MNEILDLIKKQGSLGKRRVFGFDENDLKTYIKWSSLFNYLFVDSCENGINGIGIAYPINKRFDGTDEWFYSFNNVPSKEEEENCDICIMDLVAISHDSKKRIIEKFQTRYPNWHNQNKYALIREKPKKITNQLINKFYQNGSKENISTTI